MTFHEYTRSHKGIIFCTLIGPRSFSLWLPRNLSNHMDRLTGTRDTVFAKSRQMTGRSQTWNTVVVAGGRWGKDDKKLNTLAPLLGSLSVWPFTTACALSYLTCPLNSHVWSLTFLRFLCPVFIVLWPLLSSVLYFPFCSHLSELAFHSSILPPMSSSFLIQPCNGAHIDIWCKVMH